MKFHVSVFLLLVVLQSTGLAQRFRVSFSPSASKEPFSGKLILYLSKDNRNPKDGMADLDPFPCFAVTAKDVHPGAAVLVDDRAASFPVPLSDLERGQYYVQAVWDRNLGGRAIAQSPGNLYSRPVKVSLTKDHNAIFTLVCDQVIPEGRFEGTLFVKELRVSSALLAKTYHRPVTVDAAILLPKEYYEQPLRKFPVVFLVSGYGGDYHYYSGDTVLRSTPLDTIPCITVFLDGNCPGGHSVYANSENNGPWGDALVQEFIPALEASYRCDGARLLRGHSSGGWTVLWLQTRYPSVFDGCWSSSPDPVDFRNFQHVNLYEDDNIYYASDSSLRPVATIAGMIPVASMKQSYQQEYVIYRGEQMHSFDQVFSAKDAHGDPVRLCDPVSGKINRQCMEHWKQYDISLYLRTNWNSLRRDLDGKIRISVGRQDNFLLDGAVQTLEQEMKKLDAGMIFAYYPGDHFTVATAEYRAAGMKFLAEAYMHRRTAGK